MAIETRRTCDICGGEASRPRWFRLTIRVEAINGETRLTEGEYDCCSAECYVTAVNGRLREVAGEPTTEGR